MKNYKNDEKITVFIGAVLLILFSVFVYVGTTLDTVSGKQIVFDNADVSFADKVNDILASSVADIIPLAVITLLSHPASSLAFSAAAVSYRGLALGCAAVFAARNSVSIATVAYIASFAFISLAILAYSLVINKSKLSRVNTLLVYAFASGTLVLLRAMPALII